MRTTTKFLNASLALSSILFAVNNALSVQPAVTPLPTLSQEPVAAPNPDTGATQGSSSNPSTSGAAKPQTGAAKPSQSTTPQPTAPVAKTIVSDRIPYKYGEIQLQLTTSGGQITDISVLVGDMSYGRDVAYQTLVAATISTQGINYGNVSGATFTTEAFKQAVQNALAKG